MSVAAIGAVSAAVFAALNVSAFTALGRFYGDALGSSPQYPCAWYSVREREDRGLGGGTMPQVDIWVHCLSAYEGMTEAQALASKAKELLADAALTPTGFTHCGKVFFEDITRPVTYEIGGKVVREITAQFFTWVQA